MAFDTVSLDKYRAKLEDQEALNADITVLRDIEERRRLHQERKYREKALEPILHPYKSFVKRKLLGIEPPRLRPNQFIRDDINPNYGPVELPGQRLRRQGEAGPAVGPQAQRLSQTLEQRVEDVKTRERVRQLSSRIGELETAVSYLVRQLEKRETRQSELRPQAYAQPATVQEPERTSRLGIRPIEDLAESLRPTELQYTIPARQVPEITEPIAEAITPTEAAIEIEETEAKIPNYASHKFAKIQELSDRIAEIENPPIPREILDNQELNTPEKKMAAITQWQDENLIQWQNDSARYEELNELRSELYRIQHPIIARRIEEGGERIVGESGKYGAVQYMGNTEEEQEEVMKSLGRKGYKPGYADDITEGMREAALEAQALEEQRERQEVYG